MGFRFDWWGKFLGITWGPKGGFRFYGMAGGRKGRSKTGCLIPLTVMVMTSVLASILLVFVLL